ncbi:hypothetical protein [Thalassotalea sp. ND16A]|uniref:hypothetical protein n=1 Tax=Thalassotalea sp. ND16A TaxID=1535422 RepID=UPI00051A2624|nr:hypothetical protein [Thalassotalea sp. ND16A]KGJ99327.1 hypothetical protein ND16A_3848 [Thalassotalea sp. ND16A]
MLNTIDTITNALATYTVSVRGKSKAEPIQQYLARNFSALPLSQIESVFGFVERSTLYGGRIFERPQLSTADVLWLNNNGIGLRMPLTNHFADKAEYIKTTLMLKKYHHPLNSVICTNDDLAVWIKAEFPHFDIEASVIKNLNNLRQIDEALEIYDTVVLPMTANDDDQLLDAIPDKSRIRLFANAGCAYTCPAKICYKSISKMNKFNGGEFKCSQPIKMRDSMGMIDFDLQRLQDKGFHKFKLLRARLGNQTGY